MGVVLTAIKLAMFPVPLAAKPILGVLFVQLNVVPATVPVKLTAVVAAPVHSVWLATAPTLAVGFTVMVKVAAIPEQPPAVGVTVMVAVTGTLLVFTAVKLDMFPVPLAAKPILGVLFVQPKVVPATTLVNVTAVVAEPLHNVWLVGWLTVGVGLIVSVAIIAGPSQPFILGIMVNVTTTGVTAVVVNVPAIELPVPLAGIPVAATTLFLVHLYSVPATGLVKLIVAIGLPEHDTWNAGVATAVVVGLINTVAVTGVPTQPDAVGVIVNVTNIGALVVLIINPVIDGPEPAA